MIFKYIDFISALPGTTTAALDFRAQFVLIGEILPLFLAVTLIVLFKPLSVVIWYAALLISAAMLTVGIVIRSTPNQTGSVFNVSAEAGPEFIIAGGVSLGTLTGGYLIRYLYLKHNKNQVVCIKLYPILFFFCFILYLFIFSNEIYLHKI